MLCCGLIAAAGDGVWVVPTASLAFFLAGILLGKRLPQEAVKSSRAGGKGAGRGKKTCELYVGNLSYDATEGEVKKVFSRFSKDVSVRIIEHRRSGESKGYGFARFRSRENALEAMKALNGKELNGRRMTVSEAKKNSQNRRRK